LPRARLIRRPKPSLLPNKMSRCPRPSRANRMTPKEAAFRPLGTRRLQHRIGVSHVVSAVPTPIPSDTGDTSDYSDTE
jgi:hypothetical protein